MDACFVFNSYESKRNLKLLLIENPFKRGHIHAYSMMGKSLPLLLGTGVDRKLYVRNKLINELFQSLNLAWFVLFKNSERCASFHFTCTSISFASECYDILHSGHCNVYRIQGNYIEVVSTQRYLRGIEISANLRCCSCAE